MESPPSYNEAMASAPPTDFIREGIPPKAGGGYSRGQPPPAGFAVPPVPPPRTNYVTETVYVAPPALGPKPKSMVCPTCHNQIETATETQPNTKTHVFALILCIVGCWPCCLIPYCVDSCMTIRHSCPSCGAFIGNFLE